MNNTHDIADRLAKLEAVLDAHGARPERWPQDVRATLIAFVEEDSRAARLVAEAHALDRVLGLAPQTPEQGLSDRILAAAALLPQADVKPKLDSSQRRNTDIRPSARLRLPGTKNLRRVWPGAALLAASLAAGILIGLSGEALPTLQNVGLLAALEEGGLSAITDSFLDPGGFGGQEAL